MTNTSTTYRFVIEGVFVLLPEEKGRFGFFTTMHVAASSAIEAKRIVKARLLKRLEESKVRACNAGLLTTHYWIDDVWQIDLASHPNHDVADSGFIFHPINGSDRLVAIGRTFWMRTFKPHLFL